MIPAVGPLAYPCVTQTEPDQPGEDPCIDGACVRCSGLWLVHEVGACAKALFERGGYGIVAVVDAVPIDSEPSLVFNEVGDRLASAIEALGERYYLFEARWTIELDAEGRTNTHVLIPRKRVKKRTLRRTFAAAGLGTRVNVEPIVHPLRASCYATKIALSTFGLPPHAIEPIFQFARDLNGGSFARSTPGFYRPDRSTISQQELLASGKPYVEGVIEWARTYPLYASKLPIQLRRLVPEFLALGP
jgi:hypothetical protein